MGKLSYYVGNMERWGKAPDLVSKNDMETSSRRNN
jgi:hypothetical protein